MVPIFSQISQNKEEIEMEMKRDGKTLASNMRDFI
jgi:hypothetical protein